MQEAENPFNAPMPQNETVPLSAIDPALLSNSQKKNDEEAKAVVEEVEEPAEFVE